MIPSKILYIVYASISMKIVKYSQAAHKNSEPDIDLMLRKYPTRSINSHYPPVKAPGFTNNAIASNQTLNRANWSNRGALCNLPTKKLHLLVELGSFKKCAPARFFRNVSGTGLSPALWIKISLAFHSKIISRTTSLLFNLQLKSCAKNLFETSCL